MPTIMGNTIRLAIIVAVAAILAAEVLEAEAHVAVNPHQCGGRITNRCILPRSAPGLALAEQLFKRGDSKKRTFALSSVFARRV